MIQLYDFQQLAVDEIRRLYLKIKRIILRAPPGAGKTVMFSYIAKSAIKKGSRVLILTDRIELLTQANGTLEKFGINPGIFKAGAKKIPTDSVVIAMAETIKRRLNNPEIITWLQSFNLVIADEAHKQTFDKILIHLIKNQFLIGATATPERKGRKATQLNEFYNEIVIAAEEIELIEKGILAKPRFFGNEIDLSGVRIEKGEYSKIDLQRVYNKLNKSLVSNYEKHTKGLKTILFASNVVNSKEACMSFTEAGYNSKHLDGKTPAKERRELLTWFKNEPDAILCNANVLTTGFDEETIRAVIIWRATTSLPLLVQMVGRGSRIMPGKDEYIVLDYGNNIIRHKLRYDIPRKWSLTHRVGEEGAAPLKFCKKCDAIINAGARKCEFCGVELEIERKYIIAELKELKPPEIGSETNRCIDVMDWDGLEQITEARGHKKTWIIHRLKSDPVRLQSYAKHKGYSKYYLRRFLR